MSCSHLVLGTRFKISIEQRQMELATLHTIFRCYVSPGTLIAVVARSHTYKDTSTLFMVFSVTCYSKFTLALA